MPANFHVTPDPTHPLSRSDSRFEREPRRTKVLILGGGVGGTAAAVELERLWKKRTDVELTLVSRDNFNVSTPLLFEAATGSVEVRQVMNPIRPMLARTQFVRAEVTHVDFERHLVSSRCEGAAPRELPYDHLVVALGGAPRYDLVPGTRHARAFKTVEDAIGLRTHVIDLFERASLERDPALRARLLRFVIVGGGLVGVELAGELGDLLKSLRKTYQTIQPDDVSLHVLEAGPKLLPELDPRLVAYVEKTFARRGIRVRAGAAVQGIEPEEVQLANGERLVAATIVYAAGLAATPLVASLPLEHDRRGRIVTDTAMRSVTHPDVWALGDNAAIPEPDQPGQTYPSLAQHAHREGLALASNLARVVEGEQPLPFVAQTLGTAALLGGRRAIIQFGGLRLRGIVAWWVWRTVFLFRVPWERRLRLIADWTVALLFPADSAQLRLRAQPSESAPGDLSAGLRLS